MRLLRTALVAALLLISPLSAVAAEIELNCGAGQPNVEDFHYTWRIRGGLRFIAGLMFPTAGVGNLKTTFPKDGSDASISSELLITAAEGVRGGFYAYESEMDDHGRKTLMTYSAYAWGEKVRKERTLLDYVKRLARIRKESHKGIENKVRPLPPQEMRDVLTSIYYLRQNATKIKSPLHTSIFTDGKEYPAIFRPIGEKTFEFDGRRVNSIGFEIVGAPGGKKWPGGVKVWLSDDNRRIPFRMEMQQSFAALQLDLKTVESCAFMQARAN